MRHPILGSTNERDTVRGSDWAPMASVDTFGGRSRASSTATQPLASLTQQGSIMDAGMPASSPIPADKIYIRQSLVPESSPAIGTSSAAAAMEEEEEEESLSIEAILCRRTTDDSFDDYLLDELPVTIHLVAGTNKIGNWPHDEPGNVTNIPIPIRITIEITAMQQQHILWDSSFLGEGVLQTEVSLGHRRLRVQPDVRYALTDGKLVHLGTTTYWYQIVGQTRSPSPPPPWRIGGMTPVACTLVREKRAFAEFPTQTNDSPAPSSRLPLPLPLDLPQSREDPEGEDPEEEVEYGFGLTQMLNDMAADNTQDTSQFTPERQMGFSPTQDVFADNYAEPLIPCSAPRLVSQESQYARASQSPLLHPYYNVLGMSGLRVAESPPLFAAATDDDQVLLVVESPLLLTLAPGLALAEQQTADRSSSPSALDSPSALALTQPMSPARNPSRLQHRSMYGERERERDLGADEFLPPASPLLYGPERIILLSFAEKAGKAEQAESTPRYPYDFENMGAYLHMLTQNTPPTRPCSFEINDNDCASSIGDLSQNFVALDSIVKPTGTATATATATQEKAQVVGLPRHRNRHSIENFTDSDSDSDNGDIPAPPNVPKRSSANTSTSTSTSNSTQAADETPKAPLAAASVHRFQHMPLNKPLASRPWMRIPPQLVLNPVNHAMPVTPKAVVRPSTHTPMTPTAKTTRPSSTQTPSIRTHQQNCSRAKATPRQQHQQQQRSTATAAAAGFSVVGATAEDGFPEQGYITFPQSARRHYTRPVEFYPGSLSSQIAGRQRRHTQGVSSVAAAAAARPMFTPASHLASPFATAVDGSFSAAKMNSSSNGGPTSDAEADADVHKEAVPSDLCSSPMSLPQPSFLLQPRGSADAKAKEKEEAMLKDEKEATAMVSAVDLLFDPAIDPLSSAPASSSSRSKSSPPSQPPIDPPPNQKRLETPKKPTTPLISVSVSSGACTPRPSPRPSPMLSPTGIRKPAASSRMKDRPLKNCTIMAEAKGVQRAGLGSVKKRRLTPLHKRSSSDRKSLPAKLLRSPADAPVAAVAGPEDHHVPLPSVSVSASVSVSKSEPMLISPTPKRTTRQNSATATAAAADPADPTAAANGPIKLVTMTGFVGKSDRLRHQLDKFLDAHGIQVTEDPLLADLCICRTRLGRTLKVLCALALGIPIVGETWITAISSSCADKSSSSSSSYAPLMLLPPPDDYLLQDVETEDSWKIALRDTLRCARQRVQRGELLLAGYCVYIPGNDPACDTRTLAIMVRAAGGHILNDLSAGIDESAGSKAMARNSSAMSIDMPTTQQTIGTSSAADILEMLSAESSTEPDNESDEDWTIELAAQDTLDMDDVEPRSARRSSSTNTHGPCRRKRKTLPKLSKLDLPQLPPPPPLPKLVSQPSLIIGPPESPLPPLLLHLPSSSYVSTKRKRIDQGSSPRGQKRHSGSLYLDPQISSQEMIDLVHSRKRELGIPDSCELMVILADNDPELWKMWRSPHRATVVDSEQIIQSIIKCKLSFI